MISPVQLAQRIDESIARLEDLVDEARTAAEEAAKANAAFKVAFAKERLRIRFEKPKTTRDAAEDEATSATEELLEKSLFATNNLTVVREALRAEEAKLDGLRTISASIRVAGG